MKKVSAKTTPAPRKRVSRVKAPVIDEMVIEEESLDMSSQSPSIPQVSRKMGFILVLILFAALVAYRYQYFLIPASVNGKPVYVWDYVSTMHKQYGADTISMLTTEAMIEQEITNMKISVDQSAIDAEVDTIDKQASASGGLKAVLQAQRLTETELRKQIRIQLAVKEILKDKLVVSEQEIEDSFKKNKDFFKGVAEADARMQIKEQIENEKFQKEASVWLTEIKAKAKIVISLPGATTPTQTE